MTRSYLHLSRITPRNNALHRVRHLQGPSILLSVSHSLTLSQIIFAFILPPLGVFLERGCGADLLINVCLTILGWLPGVIHG
ncbi:hypothetical protein J3R82DRAFT_5988 [Butyriboletus roseoflavus]|nr:hypothetical protein J3R82DRAFT_5988 [Butyriboletus roseoflavus]